MSEQPSGQASASSEPSGSADRAPVRAHLLLRVLRGILGVALLAGGAVLTVLPGPGLLLIVGGLGVLAIDHPFAARLRDRLLERTADAGRRARGAARRLLVGILVVLVVTVLVTAALTALVVGSLT